jgi:hypothetical protein
VLDIFDEDRDVAPLEVVLGHVTLQGDALIERQAHDLHPRTLSRTSQAPGGCPLGLRSDETVSIHEGIVLKRHPLELLDGVTDRHPVAVPVRRPAIQRPG